MTCEGDVDITPYRRELDWLSVASRRQYYLGIMTYKVLHGLAPEYICSLFTRVGSLRGDDVVALSPRNQVFNLPNFRTEIFRDSFMISSCYFWHSLPPIVTSALSLEAFKLKLHAHLMGTELSQLQ